MNRTTHADGTRFYVCPDTGKHLSSVTTILQKTDENRALQEWRARVGNIEADRISKEATNLGTLMHTHLENHILGIPRPRGNNLIRQMAEKMADQIIKRGLNKVSEVWGSEVALYYPDAYAGTTDIIGVYDGRPAIMDFKTSKKIKKRSQIDNYMQQVAAYALSHNELFGTKIETGVIFMASRDYDFEVFVLEGQEFERHKNLWLDRLEKYLIQIQI